jgi:hypothetical protein
VRAVRGQPARSRRRPTASCSRSSTRPARNAWTCGRRTASGPVPASSSTTAQGRAIRSGRS